MKTNIKDHPLYKNWTYIQQITQNPNCPDFINHDGSVKVLFDNSKDFISWVEKNLGLRPNRSYVLTRIDENEDYCPGNLAWKTRQTVTGRSSCSRHIEYNGETKCMTEWSQLYGIPYYTLLHRLDIQKMTFEQAITTPNKVTGKQICRKELNMNLKN